VVLSRAYKRDLMFFNQYCLDFFTKVHSQAIQYGPKRSLRPSSETRQGPHPVMVMGRGQAYYDLEIAAGSDGSTTELKPGTWILARTTLAGSMRWGVGRLN
jgi:hypothetical protein